MVNAQIISDYHIEFRKSARQFFDTMPFKQGLTFGICAGDLIAMSDSWDRILYAFQKVAENYEHFIYVPGNHEYYGTDRDAVEAKLARLQSLIPNLHIPCAGKAVEVGGKRFLGDTMWFPDTPEVARAKSLLNDFFQIKGLNDWVYAHSDNLIEWLRQEIRSGDIVVTHHLPSPKSTPLMFLNTPTQPMFVNSRAEYFFHRDIVPATWIHGHTHGKIAYTLNQTQVICNPLGYPGENGPLPAAAEPSLYEI
jgi:predicted phosphodiesterase